MNVGDVQSKTVTAVRTATDVATPAVKTSISFLTTTEPIVLGYYAVGAVGLYFFGPTLLSFLIGAARGYAGDISAAGALDAVMKSGKAFLLDIRTAVHICRGLFRVFMMGCRVRRRGVVCWMFLATWLVS